MFSAADYANMSLALQLAEKGLYEASPNPRVGCVITHDTQIVGSGWHERAGQPHAEINALNIAGTSAHGATVYLTLEPCSHHGRTPPCVYALIQAGVAKVIMAMEDPNPLVSGKGALLLEEAGIEVQIGLLKEEAEALNRGFFSRMTRKRPWTRLKIAASLDGKIGLKNGLSQWITGEAARKDGHRWRARSCAIMTGIGTLQTDNPQLTVRHVKTSRQPKKVVLDSRLRVPMNARLLREDGVFVFTANDANEQKIEALCALGVHVIVLPDKEGKVDLVNMMRMLANFEINELLVEAGCKLNGALVRAGLVDELVMFLSPHLLGDKAQNMIGLPEFADLEQKLQLEIKDIRLIGQDIRIVAALL